MNDFQERLQELLIDRNLSRLQLANILGISSSILNGYFNKNYFPHIDVAIKLSNYFNCSLDYLLGRSDSLTNKNKNNNEFIVNFNNLLKENNLSIARALREMHMSETNYYRWKNGEFPRTINLIEIAKYFDTSIDYLVGNIYKN